MGQKVHPIGFRIGQTASWVSRWFSPRRYRQFLKEDVAIRRFVAKRFDKAGIAKIEIERSGAMTTVIVWTNRPGVLVGRGGSGLEGIKREIIRLLEARERDVRLEVREVRDSSTNASLVAQAIAQDLLKRLPFRRVLRQHLARITQAKEAQGAKITISGRLGGSEMSRSESVFEGRLPLQSLRANVDYAQRHAFTPYGVIGIKVWIYKGEVFDESLKLKAQSSKGT
ncbi:30S ribosomal protein S3 [Candidatus Parcubacteria bacterium]|nr:30S ribosomal protein S3 [Candidatus Parcubacteria bacterium]